MPKYCAVTAATKHHQQEARQKKQKPEWPEQIVDDANHVMLAEGGRRKNKTSVAPYFRARTISQNFVAGVCSAGRFSRTKTPSNSSNRANSLFGRSFLVKCSPDFVFS